MQIREATRSDLDELAVLFDGYRRFYEQEADIPGCRAFIEARLEAMDSTILVALEASAGESARAASSHSPVPLLGFVQLYPVFSSVRMKPAYILNDLFVGPGIRRKGVGNALMAAAEEFVRAQGAPYVILETGSGNTTAQSLYEARGWLKDPAFHYSLELG